MDYKVYHLLNKKLFGKEGEELLFRIKKLDLMDLFVEVKLSTLLKWYKPKSSAMAGGTWDSFQDRWFFGHFFF